MLSAATTEYYLPRSILQRHPDMVWHQLDKGHFVGIASLAGEHVLCMYEAKHDEYMQVSIRMLAIARVPGILPRGTTNNLGELARATKYR